MNCSLCYKEDILNLTICFVCGIRFCTTCNHRHHIKTINIDLSKISLEKIEYYLEMINKFYQQDRKPCYILGFDDFIKYKNILNDYDNYYVDLKYDLRTWNIENQRMKMRFMYGLYKLILKQKNVCDDLIDMILLYI